jgi:hypothetical protein
LYFIVMPNYEAASGTVSLPEEPDVKNVEFGYALWENIVDPANPEGPKAIAMRVPAHALSKVWELVKPGYTETIELLEGSASLVVHRGEGESEEWVTMPLTADNPTADNVVLECGNQFCVVTDGESAVLLSRPSTDFDISFEKPLTATPLDDLSRFVVGRAAASE